MRVWRCRGSRNLWHRVVGKRGSHRGGTLSAWKECLWAFGQKPSDADTTKLGRKLSLWDRELNGNAGRCQMIGNWMLEFSRRGGILLDTPCFQMWPQQGCDSGIGTIPAVGEGLLWILHKQVSPASAPSTCTPAAGQNKTHSEVRQYNPHFH